MYTNFGRTTSTSKYHRLASDATEHTLISCQPRRNGIEPSPISVVFSHSYPSPYRGFFVTAEIDLNTSHQEFGPHRLTMPETRMTLVLRVFVWLELATSPRYGRRDTRLILGRARQVAME